MNYNDNNNSYTNTNFLINNNEHQSCYNGIN